MMKGYKAFNDDWTCRDFQYKVGETYSIDEEPIMCERGFHFCENPIDVFGYYPLSDDTVIAEVEAEGDILQEGTKFCTNKIRIIREFTGEELAGLVRDGRYNSGDYNSGNRNSGNRNSGDYNSGNRNSGDYNSGNRNSGNRNSGDHNSGDCNSGDCNSGDFNSGSYNSGWHNSGSRNSGDCNSGWHNSGSRNSGDYNSGDFNRGHHNSGSFNSGDYNSGWFCTGTPKIILFDKDTDMTVEEWLKSDYIKALRSTVFDIKNSENYNEAAKKWWGAKSDDDKEIIKSIPNFDADKFKEITGIDVRSEKE